MTIDKAIKELEEFTVFPHAVYPGRLMPSIKLGIEALRRLQAIRLRDSIEALTSLPGETEEVK